MCLQLILIAIVCAPWVFAAPDKIVCYHESWSNWRPATGKFDISNIDTGLCTHVIYSHIGIQSDGSIYFTSDDPGFLLAYGVLRTRNPRPKLLVSIKGWSELSIIIANLNRHRTFLNNSINFLTEYSFDGVDFNLEDLEECDSTNYNYFDSLLNQFYVEFNKTDFLLTASVSSNTNKYKVPNIVRSLHFVNIKTYQFQGTCEAATGHNLLYSETVKIINAWKNAGAPPEKLILGISAYGYSYKLKHNTVGTPMILPGDAGAYTQQAGSLSYLEICEKIKSGVCIYKWNDEELVPYAIGDNEWIIYEDTDLTMRKAKFALENNLGGISIWSVNTDDFRGSCGSKYPLLNAVKNVLKQGGCIGNCTLLGNIICNHESSSHWRQGLGKFDLPNIDTKLCTHINLASVGFNNGGNILLNAEDETFLAQCRDFKSKNPKLKLLITIGGGKVCSANFSAVAGNTNSRNTLLATAFSLIGRFNFDGADFHWEDLTDPVRGGNTNDMKNFIQMLAEFRARFNTRDYLLTATVSPSTRYYYDAIAIARSLDFINVKTFDFHGPWESRTGLNSPLSESVGSILAWKSAAVPLNKLVLGIGAYGTSFTLSNASDNGIGALSTGPGTAGPYTKEPGFLGYNEICEKLMSGWTRNWSNEHNVPYAFSGNQWVGYDDVESITKKAKFAIDLKLGGIMVSTIDTDDFRGVCGTRYPLLNAVRNGMTRSSILTLMNEESTPEDIKFLKEEDISNEFEVLQSEN